jgi:hypothetical protein
MTVAAAAEAVEEVAADGKSLLFLPAKEKDLSLLFEDYIKDIPIAARKN